MSCLSCLNEKLVKRCSKCRTICLPNKFNKDKSIKDGLSTQSKSRKNQKQKEYNSENKDKRNKYPQNKRKTDMFRLIGNTRRRTLYALKSNTKPSSTKGIYIYISGIDIETH